MYSSIHTFIKYNKYMCNILYTIDVIFNNIINGRK